MFASSTLFLEYWDGLNWDQIDYQINQPWILSGFSGGSWQRWPAAYQTIWRLQNGSPTSGPWEIDEFAFYDTSGCEGTPLVGDIIVSGYRGQYTGLRAVDGKIRTDVMQRDDGGLIRYPDSYWRSDCGPCRVGEANIGVDFGWIRRQVKCMRIVQGPSFDRQSSTVDLMYWSGYQWVLDPVNRFLSVGGGSWNRRPAASNQM